MPLKRDGDFGKVGPTLLWLDERSTRPSTFGGCCGKSLDGHFDRAFGFGALGLELLGHQGFELGEFGGLSWR